MQHLSDIQRRVLWYLRRVRSASRIEIAQALSLTNSKMTSISKELTSLSLVREREVREEATSRGRPMVPLEISPQGGYTIGATVQPGWMEIAVVDFSGRMNHVITEPFTSKDPYDFVAKLDDFIRHFSSRVGLMQSRFLGLGIAVAGFTDRNNIRHRMTVPWLEGWRNLDLQAFFEAELGHQVWIENDATSAALAELYCGQHLRNAGTSVVLYLGHGVGGGVIINDDLYRGSFLNAGEAGMLSPAGQGVKRPSGIDLINELQLAGATISSLHNIELALDKYPEVEKEWIIRAARQLKPIIFAADAWLDPSKVIISGAIPNRILVGLKEQMMSEQGWNSIQDYTPYFDIEVSELGSQSVVWGAGLLPIHNYTSDQ